MLSGGKINVSIKSKEECCEGEKDAIETTMTNQTNNIRL